MESFLLNLGEWLAGEPLSDYGSDVTAGQLLGAAVILVGALATASLLLRLLRRLAQKVTPDSTGPPRALRVALRVFLLLIGLVWALRVIGINLNAVLNDELWTRGNEVVTPASLLVAMGMLVGTYVVSRLIQAWLARSTADASRQARANVATFGTLLHYGVMLLGIALALDNVGVDLTALFAVGGIAMIAIGFGMQTITQNFISGVILMTERSIKQDDILQVDGRVVRVTAMGIRTTIVRTRDGEELIVPNSALAQGTVKNFTYRDSNYRLRVAVGVTYDSDVRRVYEVLRAAANSVDGLLQDPAPKVLLIAFGNSSVDFEVNAWIDDPWQSRDRLSRLHDTIWWALESAEITIAFPQLDLHLDPPVVESARVAAGLAPVGGGSAGS